MLKTYIESANSVPNQVKMNNRRNQISCRTVLPPAGEGETRLCVWWLRILHDVDSRVAWDCVPGEWCMRPLRGHHPHPPAPSPASGRRGDALVCVWASHTSRCRFTRSLGLCPGRAVSAAIARSPPSSPDPLFPPAGEGETRLGMEDASGLRPKT